MATPLFERAAPRVERERRESQRLHPSGHPRAVEVTGDRRVTVQAGDCLWSIAAEDLGTHDPQRIDRHWRAIFRANHTTIGADPNRLLPGQFLRLPEDATE
ncbi:MAG: LysM peptidoglycan-binding domain-containing protein [Actinomycetota bacterium]